MINSILFTKLSEKTMNYVGKMSTSRSLNSEALSIAAARVISSKLPLPTSLIEGLTSYYRSTHYFTVQDYIDNINSYIPLNVDQVRDYTIQFYKNRYDIAFMDPSRFIGFSKDTAISDFFGLSWAISKDLENIIIENIEDISLNITGINYIFNDLTDFDKAQIKNQG